MNDLISRQAAIDALWKLRRGQQMLDDTQTADKVMKGIFLAEQMIKELPTVDIDLSDYSDRLWRNAYEQGRAEAEAEIIHCRDCEWYKTNYTWNGKEHKVCGIEPFEPIRQEEDYCSYGERKDDAEVHS